MQMTLRQVVAILVLSVMSSIVFAQDMRDPEALYRDFCFSCHGTGWDQAPVVGDDFDWAPRREQGMAVMLERTVNGYNAMPPNGGCGDCTEQELQAVIEWMID